MIDFKGVAIKVRSNSVIPKIENDVIKILKETSLSCTIIGKQFGCSRGPIWDIQTMNNIKRPFNPRTKNFPIPCKTCGNSFNPPTRCEGRENRGKFCSKECYTLWQKSEVNRGKDHPNYVDGGKHEDYLNHLRKSAEWKVWRAGVFERDNYTCQLCGDRGLELHPHHIKQKSDFPNMIFVIDNGITLCKECHRSKGVHSYKSNIYRMFLENISKKNEAMLMHRGTS